MNDQQQKPDLTVLASPNSTHPRSGQAQRGSQPAAGSALPSPLEADRGDAEDTAKQLAEFESRMQQIAREKLERRAEQNRTAKQRQRLRQAAVGDRVLEITVTANEWALLEALREQQRGPREGFLRRALILGAAFAANAGNPRGKKLKGNVQAAAITGRAK